MTERGLLVEGRLTLESRLGTFDVVLARDSVTVDPAGPLALLRGLLWMASRRHRRSVRAAARALSSVTGQPVTVRMPPGLRIPLSR